MLLSIPKEQMQSCSLGQGFLLGYTATKEKQRNFLSLQRHSQLTILLCFRGLAGPFSLPPDPSFLAMRMSISRLALCCSSTLTCFAVCLNRVGYPHLCFPCSSPF
uniref:Uncharacterized protein n=1 Tax=Sphaerodactylus townsendi TaxID=933632 RepID=A0ACB8FBR2_9SAUR